MVVSQNMGDPHADTKTQQSLLQGPQKGTLDLRKPPICWELFGIKLQGSGVDPHVRRSPTFGAPCIKSAHVGPVDDFQRTEFCTLDPKP